MKRIIPFFALALFLSVFLVLKSCVINNHKSEECQIIKITIKSIT